MLFNMDKGSVSHILDKKRYENLLTFCKRLYNKKLDLTYVYNLNLIWNYYP